MSHADWGNRLHGITPPADSDRMMPMLSSNLITMHHGSSPNTNLTPFLMKPKFIISLLALMITAAGCQTSDWQKPFNGKTSTVLYSSADRLSMLWRTVRWWGYPRLILPTALCAPLKITPILSLSSKLKSILSSIPVYRSGATAKTLRAKSWFMVTRLRLTLPPEAGAEAYMTRHAEGGCTR